MPTQTQEFSHTLTEHRAKVASLKASTTPADVLCKEYLIPIQRSTQLPVKLYRPKDISEFELLPTFFYVPGTAFIAWETAYTNVICSRIAERAQCQVIALYHRLAPEDKFSAGYEDAYQILHAILQASSDYFHLDCNHIALGGYSSGGNLAALMTIRAKQAKLPICYQALISPLVDLSRTLTDKTQYKPFKAFQDKDQVISEKFVNWFISLYLPEDVDRKHAIISPFWQKRDNIRGLPPTDIIYGENDRFRSDAEAYANKLKAEHVPVTHFMFEKEDHSFMWHNMAVIETIAGRLKQVFSNAPIPRPLQDKHRLIHTHALASELWENEDRTASRKSKL